MGPCLPARSIRAGGRRDPSRLWPPLLAPQTTAHLRRSQYSRRPGGSNRKVRRAGGSRSAPSLGSSISRAFSVVARTTEFRSVCQSEWRAGSASSDWLSARVQAVRARTSGSGLERQRVRVSPCAATASRALGQSSGPRVSMSIATQPSSRSAPTAPVPEPAIRERNGWPGSSPSDIRRRLPIGWRPTRANPRTGRRSLRPFSSREGPQQVGEVIRPAPEMLQGLPTGRRLVRRGPPTRSHRNSGTKRELRAAREMPTGRSAKIDRLLGSPEKAGQHAVASTSIG